MRLRQIALVAADLESVAVEIERELEVQRCFSDPGVGEFGLHNVLFPVGDTFLEIVSPTRPGTTAGRLLERRGGDGGYMVILQTDDLDAVRGRVDAAGVRIVYEARARTVHGLHLHPRDIGGAIVSIDRSDPPEDWEWAGPVWRDHVVTDVVTEIVGVSVQADDPGAMAARWGEVIGVDATDDDRLVLDRGTIRFVPVTDGRGEGVSAVECATSLQDRVGTTVEVGGVRFDLV